MLQPVNDPEKLYRHIQMSGVISFSLNTVNISMSVLRLLCDCVKDTTYHNTVSKGSSCIPPQGSTPAPVFDLNKANTASNTKVQPTFDTCGLRFRWDRHLKHGVLYVHNPGVKEEGVESICKICFTVL